MGLPTDRNKPIEIESDYAEIDDINRIATYKGNVVVVQGSIRLTGDLMIVRYSNNNEVSRITLDGQPAHFKQQLDATGKEMKGEALKIDYHAKDSLIHLIEAAKVDRGGQIYTGHYMEYSTERNVFKIKMAPTGERGGKSSPQDRVKMVLPPPRSDAKKEEKK
jgi:lipopolysaccharide export system protein LptA